MRHSIAVPSRRDLFLLLADFLEALDEDRDPAVSGREALKVQGLIEAILRSSAEGRPVELAGR